MRAFFNTRKIKAASLFLLFFLTLTVLVSYIHSSTYSPSYYTFAADTVNVSKMTVDSSQLKNGYVYVDVPANKQLQVKYDNTLLSVFPVLESRQQIKVRLVKLDGQYTFQLHDEDNVVDEQSVTANGLTNRALTQSSYFTDYTATQYVKLPAVDTQYDEYVHKTLKYSKKDLIEKNYKPNLDVIVLRKYGICTDFAAYAGALFSMANTPYKFVYGKHDGEYHAWLEVYENNSWKIKDPTLLHKAGTYEPIYYY